MPKDPAKKLGVKRRVEFTYNKQNIPVALEEVRRGASLRSVAAKYCIAPSTLHNKLSNKYELNAKKGLASILPDEIEQQLVEWIIFSRDKGFPVDQEQLLNSIRLIVQDQKIPKPFTNDKPGRHWYKAFLRRHPMIKKRTCQNLTYSRASVTEQNLRDWFSKQQQYLVKANLLNIDANRIFNGDESGFRLSPDAGKVLVKKGVRSVYKIVGGSEKEQITSLFIFNAAGMQAPPLVLFSYKRLPTAIAARCPKGWSIGKTDNGWMTSESFYEYVVNVFYPWPVKQQIQLPVILYLDGHSSHFTLPLSQFCQTHEIILIALYPNSTHVTQPLDRALFRSLKKVWSETLDDYKRQNKLLEIRREDFGPDLKLALEKLDVVPIMKHGFEVCGLHPFNVDAVDYSLLKFRNIIPESASNSTSHQADSDQVSTNLLVAHDPLEESKKLLQAFDNNLDAETLQEVKECEMRQEWTGDISNKGLFDMWMKLRERSGLVSCQNAAEENPNEGNYTSNNQSINISAIPDECIIISDSYEQVQNSCVIFTDEALETFPDFLETPENLEGTSANNNRCNETHEENRLLESLRLMGDAMNNTLSSACLSDSQNADIFLEHTENQIEVASPTALENTVSVNLDINHEQEGILDEERVPDESTETGSTETSKSPGDKPQNSEGSCQDRVVPEHIKSPLKRLLTWPQPVHPKKKKNPALELSSVASCEEWIPIHQKIAEEKKRKSREQERRKSLAAEKKILEEQIQKKQMELKKIKEAERAENREKKGGKEKER